MQGKRSRLDTETPSPDGTTDTPDTNPDDMEGVYTYTYTAPTSDPINDLDLFSSDEEDAEDIDEARATEMVRKSMEHQAENKASDSGIIEEVSMRNFMCHSRLTIPLGPLINFIIGHNGSGKSAILTAITICLGAKASVTNRAGSLKSFIKEGEE